MNVTDTATAGGAIGQLRRLSGLTWDQLAQLFRVSRRSLHFWASGKPIAALDEAHLLRTLATLQYIDRGSSTANRRLLLNAGENGMLPLDLLAAGHYERVRELLGPGENRRISTPSLSERAHEARTPFPPEELVGALQDRIHRDNGKIRIAKSVKTRSGH